MIQNTHATALDGAMRLSKSNYLLGRQCSRRLWLAKHGEEPEPVIESEEVWEIRGLEGEAVERIVESLYDDPRRTATCPESEDVDEVPPGANLLAARTLALLNDRRPTFQAYLLTDKLLAVADILEPRDGGWYVWEVKASTQVSPLHDHDLAFQVEVARQAGLDVVGAGVWHLRAEYVRGAEIDPGSLMKAVDRTREVEALAEPTRAEILRQLATVDSIDIPDATPGPRCRANREAAAGDRPSTCGHLSGSGYCGRRLPEHWNGQLIGLTGEKARKLTERPEPSIETIDLDDDELTWTTMQRRMIEAVQAGEPFIDRTALRAELDKLVWPISYVDFEFDPGMAVPRFPGTRPYARIPFQWSMRIHRRQGAELEEPESFLWIESTDPRQAFLDALLAALPETGSIVVHSRSAELTVLRQLGQALAPAYASRVQALEPRLYDTIDLLRAGYYHPAQHGSYSIKKVAPAVLGRGYDNLAIQDGMAAVVGWKRALAAGDDSRTRDNLAAQLREYCGRDTMLMHDLIEAMRALARAPT